jgi:hypothetical protein
VGVLLRSVEMVVARRKMKIFTYGMIDQLHKRSILGPPGRWPVRLVFLETLRRQNFIHIPFSHFLHPLCRIPLHYATGFQPVSWCFLRQGTQEGDTVISVHTHLALSLVFVSSAGLDRPLFQFLRNEGLLSVSHLSVCPYDSYFHF